MKISNEITITQRRELKRLEDQGIMEYYNNVRNEDKDGTRDRTQATRVFKRAVRPRPSGENENMEVVTGSENDNPGPNTEQ